jgi:hypothetical protein
MLGAMVGITTGDDDDGQSASSANQPGRQDSAQNDVMTLTKLLATLNKVERVRGFYDSPDAIKACRKKGAELPQADDTEGWRQLYVDARDWALEHFDRAVEDGKISSSQISMSEEKAIQSAMDEIVAEDEESAEIPF